MSELVQPKLNIESSVGDSSPTKAENVDPEVVVLRRVKAYNYRLYPNEEQAVLINKTFGCVRFVYNQMLAHRKTIYEQYKNDKEALKQQKYALPADY